MKIKPYLKSLRGYKYIVLGIALHYEWIGGRQFSATVGFIIWEVGIKIEWR